MSNAARKAPRQERSRVTVEAIVQAAATVFREVGYERASTNQIAMVAGVSIGSLYQYFPDKNAIAAELLARIEANWAEDFQAAAATFAHAPVADVVRALLAGFLDGYERDVRLVHVLFGMPTDSGAPKVPCAPPVVIDTIRALLELRRAELPDVDIATAPQLLARVVDAATYGAFLDGTPRRHIEEQLVRLCLGFLYAKGP